MKSLLDVLVEYKMVSSKSEGRRLISQGGLWYSPELPNRKAAWEKITNEDFPIGVFTVIIRRGKRKFLKIIGKYRIETIPNEVKTEKIEKTPHGEIHHQVIYEGFKLVEIK